MQPGGGKGASFGLTLGGRGASKDYSNDSPKIKLKDSPKVFFLNLNI